MDNLNLLKKQRQPRGTTALNDDANHYDMVVFCHLRWEFVYQRPQHLISRMAKNFKILFVEEPISFSDGEEFSAHMIQVNRNLAVMQPKVRSIADIPRVLNQYIANNVVPMAWFYSASFVSILDFRTFETVIYDCMDELSLFKGAPQQLIDNERTLLSQADIVFTGGKSLYESKQQLHDNVYCFPSSVDQEHFATALNGIAIPDDISQIPSPIVGYFGVIDERINLELISESARLLPNVSFVMIGPLAKISENDLPRLSNLHYLGMKSYEQLPAYLKAFDVAMMPFALNDATKFISPTKTLEYMAAGKPIISTRIKDVERDYQHCVAIVDSLQDFCDAVQNIKIDKSSRMSSYAEILSNTSWDTTASKMQNIIKQKTL